MKEISDLHYLRSVCAPKGGRVSNVEKGLIGVDDDGRSLRQGNCFTGAVQTNLHHRHMSDWFKQPRGQQKRNVDVAFVE